MRLSVSGLLYGMELRDLKAVEIEINSHCNKACSYCPNSIEERIEKGSMDPILFERIIDQLVQADFKGKVCYDFYNEPTLCKHLDSFVSLTKKKLPKSEIHLYSNGSLLTRERFLKLYELGVTHFIITKHEDEGEDNKPYLFEQTFKDLEEDLKNIVRLRTHKDLHLTNRGGSLEHIKINQLDISTLSCFIPSFMLTITVLGNVIPCFEDYFQKNQMGNIKEESLETIWNKPAYKKMRNALMLGARHKFEVCAKCNRLEVRPPV